VNSKQVPVVEVSRLREHRRRLQAEVARLEAEKQGWLVEKAHLLAALEEQRGSDGAGTKDRLTRPRPMQLRSALVDLAARHHGRADRV